MDKVKALEEAQRVLEEEKTALVRSVASRLDEKKWLVREGFSMAVDMARESDGFVNAIVAMNEAVKMVGHHDELVLGFNVANAKKKIQDRASWNPDAHAALFAKKGEFDEMDFPFLDEQKMMVDDPDISRLKDLLISNPE